jgi:hypothetical protein
VDGDRFAIARRRETYEDVVRGEDPAPRFARVVAAKARTKAGRERAPAAGRAARRTAKPKTAARASAGRGKRR